MYWKKIPSIVQRYYSNFLWSKSGKEKVLYLTFDDGPTPEVTPWVLEQLATYQAKATFFLIGDRVKQYPEIAHQILDAGHSVGNHTQHHVNGRKTPLRTYLKEVLEGQKTIREYTGRKTRLFRPPYGRITQPEALRVLQSHEIVMMDVISGDFDPSLTAEHCREIVIKKAGPGSIVVFHDSEKAWDRLKGSLPGILEYFGREGYYFKPLLPSSNHVLVE